MALRNVDLNRCLFHYPNITCSRCQDICPQQAIHNREIDFEKCDNCGLCTAVCPTGAIHSDTDYDTALTAVKNLSPQVLMCKKVSPQSIPCLGALNRRLLWALAEKQELCIDTSRCQSCNPAVASWLTCEIEACSIALQEANKAPIKLVHVRETTPAPQPVARRSFFRSLFHTASKTAAEIAKAQTNRQYAFDSVIWLTKQNTSPNGVFPRLSLTANCTVCGLCNMLCPEKALHVHRENNEPALTFDPIKCTSCALCVNNCPQAALTLQSKK